MDYLNLMELDISDQRVLVRLDLNVPLRDGKITSTARIDASLPTIQAAMAAGARVMLMSHLGRPQEGKPEQQYSLAPIARYLAERLDCPVPLSTDYLHSDPDPGPGEVILLENVRFNIGEKDNEESLARRYAALCDVYVMDAFGTAHRAQASTHGAGVFAPIACAGPLLHAELVALGQAFENPVPPTVAIVGGSKVSTKLTVLESLGRKVDQLVTGGGIANTFIAAAGYGVGSSLYEPELVEEARGLIRNSKDSGSEIPIPVDVVVGSSFDENTTAVVKAVDQVADDELILDIGPQTADLYDGIIRSAGTIIWNGPVGVFEYEQFSNGTRRLGESIAASTAYSIAGGGDTLAAIDRFGLEKDISYISTGGGAFLEFLEGKTLPAVAMLAGRKDG